MSVGKFRMSESAHCSWFLSHLFSAPEELDVPIPCNSTTGSSQTTTWNCFMITAGQIFLLGMAGPRGRFIPRRLRELRFEMQAIEKRHSVWVIPHYRVIKITKLRG